MEVDFLALYVFLNCILPSQNTCFIWCFLDRALRCCSNCGVHTFSCRYDCCRRDISSVADVTVSVADVTISVADATVFGADVTVSVADVTVSVADVTVSVAMRPSLLQIRPSLLQMQPSLLQM